MYVPEDLELEQDLLVQDSVHFEFVVMANTVKLGLEGPPGPGHGLCRWPLQAPHGKGRGKFQTLWSLASRSRGRARRHARATKNPKESSDFAA